MVSPSARSGASACASESFSCKLLFTSITEVSFSSSLKLSTTSATSLSLYRSGVTSLITSFAPSFRSSVPSSTTGSFGPDVPILGAAIACAVGTAANAIAQKPAVSFFIVFSFLTIVLLTLVVAHYGGFQINKLIFLFFAFLYFAIEKFYYQFLKCILIIIKLIMKLTKLILALKYIIAVRC